VTIPSILIPKDDGDNFLSVLKDPERQIQLSMAFPLLTETTIVKTLFLLQVDNFNSYQLLADFEKYIYLLKNDLKFEVHYRVYKNTPLDENGDKTDEDPSTMPEVVLSDDDYYFVLQDGTFHKDHLLFYESLKQLCLHYSNREIYFNYMKHVRQKCFVGPDEEGNFKALKAFMSCTQGIYGSLIKGNDKELDEVNLIRK
jgi:hypothetical protein